MKVLCEKKGHIALVTINRPEVRNCFDPETTVRLAEAWRGIKADDEIRVAVVTGAGEKAFCSGADLGRMLPLMSGDRMPEDEWDRMVAGDGSYFETALLRSFDIGKPVIAAISGIAVSGGMELAQGTDIRIASETAVFGMPEVRWAIFPKGGSTVRLPRQVSQSVAMELLLTGDMIDARRALEIGFVSHVVPQAEVLDKAMQVAERIARNGPLAARAIRQSVRECFGRPEDEALQMEQAFARPVFESDDIREGPRAFMEKREPRYSGR